MLEIIVILQLLVFLCSIAIAIVVFWDDASKLVHRFFGARNRKEPSKSSSGQSSAIETKTDRVNQANAEFVTAVSHRFQTPLSVIRWNTEAILDLHASTLDPEVKDYVQDAHEQTMYLTETLELLLEGLEIESGVLKMESKAFDLKKSLAPIEKAAKRKCLEKGVTCKIDINAGLIVTGDERKLLGAIRRLIENSIRYTPQGGEVTVSARMDSDGKHVIVTVRDTGIGIPEDEIGSVFDKFFRAKNAPLAYPDGHGLGLYFAKHMVEAHTGTVKVNSSMGEGTVFTVVLPATQVQPVRKSANRGTKKKTTVKKK